MVQDDLEDVQLFPARFRHHDEANGSAYVFHEWCYSILLCRNGGPCDIVKLFSLARTLSYFPSDWQWQYLDIVGIPENVKRATMEGAQFLDLQPSYMLRLPSELRTLVWSYVDDTNPYSSMILTSSEAARLLACVREAADEDIVLRKGELVTYNEITIFGTSYIKNLATIGGNGVGYRIPGTVDALEFVASHAGICAIKLSGQDWKSPWLGTISNLQCLAYGIARGALSHLTIRYSVSYKFALNC